MSEWEIIWQSRDIFLKGLGNTALLFALSFSGAFLIGCMANYFLDRGLWVRQACRLYMSVMRMVPFLVLVYLIYYGLPQYGIRIDAWTAGAIALALYHGAYFAEILRGNRLTLPLGQVESAKAHGFRPLPMYLHIVLPQLLFRSRPLIGNQMVYAMKDTSFLSIITVQELTAAANTVQSSYFIPTKAFIVSIAFYIILSMLMDLGLRRAGTQGVQRGFEHA
ncbi:polar amino acid transport system permease protein [Pseudomonas sp. ok272]|uniref:amino acid ABC transporter permease n=1 Tax=unclassified Pseudomonas TaxID=196821 RepID=UPI0008BE4A2F|nr:MULTISPECIES: amino acid ABC transporter permease [unclassified Pseudomonas]SEN23913.1 polar amino acid transport system permease protein [Pseudomonas sp. ok272]SFN15093.1 polar amino acid transport system permease protein [Pseudomonas sp. ok602]